MSKSALILVMAVLLNFETSVYADNSLFVSLYAQFSSGHLCADIKQADVRNSDMACATPFNRKLAAMAGPASWLLDTFAFDAAVRPQIRRDKCVAQRARALAQVSPARKGWWRALLAKAWLGRRKAKLTLQFCDTNFNSHIPSSLVSDDPDKNWEQWKRMDRLTPLYPGDPKKQQEREAEMQKWVPICFNDDAIQALKSADELFAYNVPVIESETLFGDMEANRNVLVDKRTGQPLTDPTILNSDLRQMPWLEIKFDPAFNAKIDQRLADIGSTRDRSAADLENSRDEDGHYHLSPDQHQYLYEEGTLTDALTEHYKPKGKDSLPAALACFDARYGSHPQGELMSLAFFSALSGGAYGFVAGNVRLAKTLSLAVKARQRMNAGLTLATSDRAFKQVWDTCTNNKSPYGKQSNTWMNEKEHQGESGDLPGEEGWKIWETPIDPKLTPACEGQDVQHDLIRANETRSCAKEILENGLPSLIGLPH